VIQVQVLNNDQRTTITYSSIKVCYSILQSFFQRFGVITGLLSSWNYALITW